MVLTLLTARRRWGAVSADSRRPTAGGSRLLEHRNNLGQMVGNHPSQQEVAAGDRRGGHKGGGRDPVRDHMMLCSGELFHSFDDDPAFAAPDILAPQAFRKPHKSQISGSLAALVITVSPSAVAAASKIFSVAPTLGKVRLMVRREAFL